MFTIVLSYCVFCAAKRTSVMDKVKVGCDYVHATKRRESNYAIFDHTLN